MIVQLLCVCDVYCTVCVYGTLIVSYKSITLHVLNSRAINSKCHECSIGVILKAKHFLILSGPDIPAYL